MVSKRKQAGKWKHIEKQLEQIDGPCPDCPKVGHRSRSQAKKVARRRFPNVAMSIYQCTSGFWHIGHLPARIKQGDRTRGEYFGGNR